MVKIKNNDWKKEKKGNKNIDKISDLDYILKICFMDETVKFSFAKEGQKRQKMDIT